MGLGVRGATWEQAVFRWLVVGMVFGRLACCKAVVAGGASAVMRERAVAVAVRGRVVAHAGEVFDRRVNYY